jgi:hypothetical protein
MGRINTGWRPAKMVYMQAFWDGPFAKFKGITMGIDQRANRLLLSAFRPEHPITAGMLGRNP